MRLTERPSTQAPERRVRALAGRRDHDQARVRPLERRRAQGEIDLVVGVRVQLVDDRERRRQAVQARSVGGEDAQVAREHVRLAGSVAVAKLEVADDDVLVVEHASEVGRGFVQDPGLLPTRGGAVDGRVLDRDEVVERDRGEERRLPLPAREQGDELPLGASGRLRDPTLERLEVEPDPLTERLELHSRQEVRRPGGVPRDPASFRDAFDRDERRPAWPQFSYSPHR